MNPRLAPPQNVDQFARIRAEMGALRKEVQKVIVGKPHIIDQVMIAALADGSHILFEDVPGLAKSVLAATFSKASGCGFRRIQFTPDLLPTDISGGHIFNRKTNEFDFRPGPIFTNFLLADEINRASPKTQSALLEAMAEKQVSVEGITHRLSAPFIVLATQNPVEQEGTYPLPEAQMDRFAMRLSMGYPTDADEAEIIHRRLARKQDGFATEAIMDNARLARLQRVVEDVEVSPHVIRYIAAIIGATRRHAHLAVGSSPRGSLALTKLSRARAALEGRGYVLPDDVKGLAEPVLAHRLILTREAKNAGVRAEQIVNEIINTVPVPRGN